MQESHEENVLEYFPVQGFNWKRICIDASYLMQVLFSLICLFLSLKIVGICYYFPDIYIL